MLPTSEAATRAARRTKGCGCACTAGALSSSRVVAAIWTVSTDGAAAWTKTPWIPVHPQCAMLGLWQGRVINTQQIESLSRGEQRCLASWTELRVCAKSDSGGGDGRTKVIRRRPSRRTSPPRRSTPCLSLAHSCSRADTQSTATSGNLQECADEPFGSRTHVQTRGSAGCVHVDECCACCGRSSSAAPSAAPPGCSGPTCGSSRQLSQPAHRQGSVQGLAEKEPACNATISRDRRLLWLLPWSSVLFRCLPPLGPEVRAVPWNWDRAPASGLSVPLWLLRAAWPSQWRPPP